MNGHRDRVGSVDTNPVLAHSLVSGSKDGMVFEHDLRRSVHVAHCYENHTQEVCGLKWSSEGSSIASGGNDNLLNIWDVGQSQQPRFVFKHHVAAVRALAWSPFQRNLLASGGGTADRTIRFWNTATGACLNYIDTKSQVRAQTFFSC